MNETAEREGRPGDRRKQRHRRRRSPDDSPPRARRSSSPVGARRQSTTPVAEIDGERRSACGPMRPAKSPTSTPSSPRSASASAVSTCWSRTPGGGSFAPLGEITEEQYHDTFDVNVKGNHLHRPGPPRRSFPDGASVILIGSNASAPGAAPAFSVYSASKAAVRTSLAAGRSTSRTARSASTPLFAGIPVDSPVSSAWFPTMRSRASSTPSPPRSPWVCVADPAEIAGAALFLASCRTRASSTASSSSPTGDRLRCREDGRGPRRVEAPGGQAAAGDRVLDEDGRDRGGGIERFGVQDPVAGRGAVEEQRQLLAERLGSVAPALRAASVSRAAKAFL